MHNAQVLEGHGWVKGWARSLWCCKRVGVTECQGSPWMGKAQGLCKASLDGAIFGLTDGHRAGLQLGLVPWGFISFVQLLRVGSWSLAGAAGWNRQ